jgi:phosphoinositide-3-kinase regulatory subunit 4
LSFEQEAEKNLKSIGDIELPKLGVTPQTVFLKARSSDFSASRSSRTHMRKTSALGTPLLSPIMGRMDHTGAPFEDLRRRLATINGSSSSIILTPPREPRTALSPIAATPGFPVVGISSPIERPGSPTDSVVSTANSTTFRPLSRMQFGGADGQKAAPAVGSSKTNAVGHLDGRSKLRSDGSPEPSGRSSPMSMSTTIRGPLRQRVPSLLPISTYGKSLKICRRFGGY